MLLEFREKYAAALMLLADMAINAQDHDAFKDASSTFLTEVGGEYKLSADVEMSVVKSIDLLRRLVLVAARAKLLVPRLRRSPRRS